MRAWELYEGEGLDRHRATGRRPIISLRHVNKLKWMKAAVRNEREQRLALWKLMYGQDDVADRQMDRRKADLDGREQELRMQELQAKIQKSIDDAEVDQKAKQRLHQMAMAELHRRQKKSSQHETPREACVADRNEHGARQHHAGPGPSALYRSGG